MIVSAFSDLTNDVLKYTSKDSVDNKSSIESSILKENYNEYIKNFNMGDLIFPTINEAKDSYNLKKDKLNKFSLRFHLDLLIDSKLKNIYKIENECFKYLGVLEFLTGHDTGVSKSSMEFFNAVYYSYVYLKKPIGNSKSSLDKLTNISKSSYIPELKKRFQEARETLARISLYEKAFKKLNMPKDLELCISNKDDTIKLISMIVFLIKLIEQIDV